MNKSLCAKLTAIALSLFSFSIFAKENNLTFNGEYINNIVFYGDDISIDLSYSESSSNDIKISFSDDKLSNNRSVKIRPKKNRLICSSKTRKDSFIKDKESLVSYKIVVPLKSDYKIRIVSKTASIDLVDMRTVFDIQSGVANINTTNSYSYFDVKSGVFNLNTKGGILNGVKCQSGVANIKSDSLSGDLKIIAGVCNLAVIYNVSNLIEINKQIGVSIQKKFYDCSITAGSGDISINIPSETKIYYFGIKLDDFVSSNKEESLIRLYLSPILSNIKIKSI